MNPEKKRWIVTTAVTLVVALGLGTLIYFQDQSIKDKRANIEQLKSQIAADRALIKKTPDLVKQVIVQRETNAEIGKILSDEENVNEFVDALYDFSTETEVVISNLERSRQNQNTRNVQDFQKVGYNLTFKGDAFQLLAFLNKVESYERFMSVTNIDLTAASRSDYDREDVPLHTVKLELETYVYDPQAGGEPVEIDQYERKRDLLIGEISQRIAELRVNPYDYRGQRSRRDPWIDPRVKIDPGAAPPTIAEQIELVHALIERVEAAKALLEEAQSADTIIEEMKLRSSLEEEIAALDAEVHRIQAEGFLVYVLAVKRFENEVVKGVEWLTEEANRSEAGQGPSLAVLKQASKSMNEFIRLQDYELAIDVFETIEPGLVLAEADERRLPLVQSLRELHSLAETVLSFESITLDITGIAIYEDARPVALINGQAIAEGEFIGDELVVRNITTDRIEFAYRGVVLARLVEIDPLN